MEEAPVTAATGALGPVVAKLSTLLRRRCGGDREYHYHLRRQTRKDVKLIRSKLKSIHSILWVIWEKEDRDTASKELRMEAWRLADDMNDAIDDFIISMKRSNDGKRFVQAKIVQPRPFQDLKRRAVDVSERCCNKWKVDIDQTTNWSLFSTMKTTVEDKRPRVFDTYVHKDISELVGMEEPMEKLIKHLVGKEDYTPELKMACIVGAAGMGKTTLAHHVYEAIKEQFQAWAFVSVTSSRNMTEVLTSILQQVAAQSIPVQPAATKPAAIEKHLVDSISNFLKDKRYLVIFDDVRHCEEWKTIKKCLPDNNLGNRIVTTCRFKSITEMWRDDFDALVYDFNIVRYYDFSAMLGEGFDRQHHSIKMCRDTPLAMACMISALAKERELQEEQGLCVVRTRDLQDRVEEQVMRNGIQNTPGFEPLVESLELGYNDLPHHMLKTCLLYCSIYPEDHMFRRNDLIRRWIAEGFVCKEEAAQDYFDELVSRILIEQHVDFFSEYHYNVHPMMRNYLRCKLREHNFITCTSDIIPSSLVGRLCIDYWPASSDPVDTLSGIDDWHHIRSLVVFKYAERVPYKHLEHLRVLDVQQYEGSDGALENQHIKDMCGLLRLRHLFVSGGFDELAITEIPTEIVRLQYLETLAVTSAKIARLPAEIGDLKQLKTLNLSWNEQLAELPREMGNLQHLLERLLICGANIRKQAWEIIGTLKKLKTLDVMFNLDLTGIPGDIGNLLHLETLNLSRTGITELPKEIGNLLHLETLNLAGTRITQLPREIWNLQRLQILDLSAISIITKLPRDIGKLQHLETLDLSGTNVKKIPREIGGLKNMKILKSEAGTLPFEAGQLSKLEWLPKCVRRAWKNSDLVSSLAGEILSFFQIWGGGDGGLIVSTKHVHIPQWIKEHFNNIGSLDIRICKLEEQDLKILREMPYLIFLHLRFEAVPRKPVAISSGGFANLWFLTVHSRVPRITFQEGAMPRLYILEFEFQFYGGPPNTDSMGIKHLVSLQSVYFRCKEWYRGDSPCISATIDAVREEAWEHPNKSIAIALLVAGQNPVFFRRPHIAETSSQGSDVACSSGTEEIEETQA